MTIRDLASIQDPSESSLALAWPDAGRARGVAPGAVPVRRLMGTAMLHTLILHTARLAPPKLGLTAWWRRYRTLLLPQITLVLGVLALLCGALWAVGEYADHRAELRLAETHRYLEEFRSGPVAAAWGRLRAAWRAEQDRQEALLARINSLDRSERARAMQDHRMFVLETIEEYGLQDEIEEVSQFLVRLATCVRVNSCDPDVAAAQLGPALWAFHDQHQYYFEFEYSGHDLDQTIATIAPRPAGRALHAAPRW